MEESVSVFKKIADASGFPEDQLKYLTCLLLLVPLSIPFRAIQNVTLKHLYSIIVSFLMLSFCLGPEAILHSLGSSFVCYLLLLYVPHKYVHKVIFVVR